MVSCSSSSSLRAEKLLWWSTGKDVLRTMGLVVLFGMEKSSSSSLEGSPSDSEGVTGLDVVSQDSGVSRANSDGSSWRGVMEASYVARFEKWAMKSIWELSERSSSSSGACRAVALGKPSEFCLSSSPSPLFCFLRRRLDRVI